MRLASKWLDATAFLLGTVCIAALVGSGGRAEDSVAPEYKLKAAFLYNFAKFVEWPAKAFAEAGSPVLIGILGDDPFGDTLEEIIRGRNIGGRTLALRHSQRVEDLKSCHILFISSSEKARQTQILDSLKDAHSLTVGEGEPFLADGGMIQLTMQQQKVRFEINLVAAESAGLKISSQLLDLASVVKRSPNKEAK